MTSKARVQNQIPEVSDVTVSVLFVTASIGIACGVALGADVDEHPATLISQADLAMYRAKRLGGDTYVVFDEGLRTRVQARLDLALALRHALNLDEFHLNYQPEIDLATGRIVDVEALLRWEHPHDGLLTPDTFLDTAEQTGLIVPIGEWVITEACAQAATWQRTYGARAPQRVFVNLSARQLLHPDLGATVEHALQTSGLDSSHLGFEVTEHVFIDDLDAATDILRRLHDHGHALSLDDFGTGYSSLTYLRRLPFDCLKIDQSFVAGLDDDHTDEHDTTAIITAIIDMAHDLGLVVTAEGVENPPRPKSSPPSAATAPRATTTPDRYLPTTSPTSSPTTTPPGRQSRRDPPSAPAGARGDRSASSVTTSTASGCRTGSARRVLPRRCSRRCSTGPSLARPGPESVRRDEEGARRVLEVGERRDGDVEPGVCQDVAHRIGTKTP